MAKTPETAILDLLPSITVDGTLAFQCSHLQATPNPPNCQRLAGPYRPAVRILSEFALIYKTSMQHENTIGFSPASKKGEDRLIFIGLIF